MGIGYSNYHYPVPVVYTHRTLYHWDLATFLIWNAGIAVVSSIAIPTAELVSSLQFQVSHNTSYDSHAACQSRVRSNIERLGAYLWWYIHRIHRSQQHSSYCWHESTQACAIYFQLSQNTSNTCSFRFLINWNILFKGVYRAGVNTLCRLHIPIVNNSVTKCIFLKSSRKRFLNNFWLWPLLSPASNSKKKYSLSMSYTPLIILKVSTKPLLALLLSKRDNPRYCKRSSYFHAQYLVLI